ncbi:hypothetical protein [Capnocytophaga sp.]|uniref:hypothetical protein n=1 Tax=Capnocytophaga sp. TaxID=44737 RepID=UPI0026DB9622|nr:hypothetical protein [Capnocytophaga sp.]MDO5106100.1 hypothetical protein [Capnocytophaga sp.]
MEYKNFFVSEADFQKYKLRLDKKVQTFAHAFMSNAKWQKFFMKVCQNQGVIKQCEIYNFFENCVNELVFSNITDDLTTYIRPDYISNAITTAEAPTLYKEIWYVEFRKISRKTHIGNLIAPTEETQDLAQIKRYLASFGEFQFEETTDYLRVFGYGN